MGQGHDPEGGSQELPGRGVSPCSPSPASWPPGRASETNPQTSPVLASLGLWSAEAELAQLPRACSPVAGIEAVWR